jgi:chromosome segregation ATPase
MSAIGDESGDHTAAPALTRLVGLRQHVAAVYASITAVEDTLRTLADQRATAERSLRAASHRHGAIVRALEAHARAKPGLRAQLSTRFGAKRAWRARQAELEAALRDRAAPVEAGQRTLAQVRAQFAATVHAQAEATAALRRLTAECAEAQAEIARARQRRGP